MAANGLTLLDASPAASFIGKVGDWQDTKGSLCTVQASLAEGASSATVLIEVSNDKIGGVTLATINLDTTARSDGLMVDSQAKWFYVRATLIAASGGRIVATASTGA